VNVIDLLVWLLNTVTTYIINEWLVKIAREMENIPSYEFDLYNEFREKWNSLLNELETRLGRFGVEINLKERAKELSVIAK
jgi:hypothetical protein